MLLVKIFAICVSGLTLAAAAPGWVDIVAPSLTPAERKNYLALKPEARAQFEQEFWAGKSITAQEYYNRVQYIDSTFGSSRPGSGANTDPGRVYLSIGSPTRVRRIPSSRIFVPLEIWYYDSVPGVLNTELRLIFYRKNSMGFPKLYSPALDTLRALLLPQAGVQGIFGPNDDITEAKIRTNLTVGPAEDEVVSAAVNVATGIKYSGNEEILGQITSPMRMLGKPPRTDVKSRFIVSHPRLDILQTNSAYGGSQVDLGLETTVRSELNIQVLEGPATVYQNQLRLKFSKAEAVRYTHRLDLLPGSYRVMFTVDGATHPYPLEVKEHGAMSEIVRADPGGDVIHRQTPFEFESKQLDFNPRGKLAVVAVPQSGKVTWTVRKGMQVIWRSTSDAGQVSTVELPAGLEPGAYELEATSESESRSMNFSEGKGKNVAAAATVLSFNANLAPALRLAFVAHQWLLRGKLDLAQRSLQSSLNIADTKEAQIEMARLDATAGRYDQARDRLRGMLAAQPNNFDALSVLAYVEAMLQDYPVAAELYRRALAVQDSPAIRLALSKLPQQ